MFQPPRSRHHLPEPQAANPTWLELFYDLVFVAVFIQIGNLLSRDVSASGLVTVLLLFAPIWWVWVNIAWYMNRFDVDDVTHRLLLLVQIFFISWIGLSVPEAFGDASTQFVLCYIGFQLTMIAMYARALRHAPEQRTLLLRHITHFHAPGAVLWGLSLLLAPEHRPYAWALIFACEVGSAFLPRFVALMRLYPVHMHHLVERFGTLIILVLGETFIKNITADPAPSLSMETMLFSAPAIATFFGLWWLYFTAIDSERAAAQMARPENPLPWILAHLPLALSLITLAVAASRLFESITTGQADARYTAVYFGSLALFFLLLSMVAGDRSRRASLPRLTGAAVFALLVVLGDRLIPHVAQALVAALIIAVLASLDWANRRRQLADETHPS